MVRSIPAGFTDALDSDLSVFRARALDDQSFLELEAQDGLLTALRLQADPAGPLFGAVGDDFLIGPAHYGYGTHVTDSGMLTGVLAELAIDAFGGRNIEEVRLETGPLRLPDGSTFVAADSKVLPSEAGAPESPLVLPGVSDEPFLLDKDADLPTVLPGVSDDAFLLDKWADVPTVLPGVDDVFEIEKFATGFDLADQPAQLVDHMMTLGDDGFLLGPTEDIGRLHDHDGWLF